MITALAPGWQSAERPDRATSWTRVVTPTVFIDHNDRQHPVFVTIRWEPPRLSISGVEGPNQNGNAAGACGQLRLDPTYAAPGWEADDVAQLDATWRRWHLNDMRAGSPAQEQWLRDHPDRPSPLEYFPWACEQLAAAGLHPDPDHDDYRYGSAWLSEDVPDEILDYLWALPNTTRAHPWGRP